MGNILIVTGRHPCVYQLGRFLPENPIVLPDIWLMSRDLQKRPAAYLCVRISLCVYVCVAPEEREKQSVGAMWRFSMVFNVYTYKYKERMIETQLREQIHTHTTIAATADPKLIYLTEKRQDLSCIQKKNDIKSPKNTQTRKIVYNVFL